MFERFVSGRRPRWKRRALLIGSLGLHAIAAVALLVASIYRVDELTPPLLAIVFNPAGQPPPPPPPPARKKATSQHKQPTLTPRTQPVVVPPTAPEPTPEDGADNGKDGGNGPKDGTGPPGGDPTSTSTGPCSGPQCIGAPAPKPRNVAPHALDAERLAGAMPHLPASVLSSGIGDSVFTAKICVDQSGAVSSVSVLSGIPGADESIVATLRGWRYKAQPIPVCFVSQFVFNIDRSR